MGDPEPCQRGGQLKARAPVIGATPSERGTKVVVVGFQPLQPVRQFWASFEALGPQRQRQVMERMSPGNPRPLAALCETVRAIYAHRIQQLVARWAGVAHVSHQERLLNEPENQLRDLVCLESASENRDPPKKAALLLIEKLVIPVEGCLQRSMAGHGDRAAVLQQAEAVVEPAQNVLDRHHLGARGGELNRQGYSVETATDEGDRLRVVRSDLES